MYEKINMVEMETVGSVENAECRKRSFDTEKGFNPSLFLPFSVNKISSLSDFEECPNLQELYLRKNNIQDIGDLAYLQARIDFNWKFPAATLHGNVNVLKVAVERREKSIIFSHNTHLSTLSRLDLLLNFHS